jgi:hypothetical protein
MHSVGFGFTNSSTNSRLMFVTGSVYFPSLASFDGALGCFALLVGFVALLERG